MEAHGRKIGARELWAYLWPLQGQHRAKLRTVGAALLLLLLAKMWVVRIPFVFKAAVDSLSPSATTGVSAAACMLFYGLSRALYTLLQEGRYLLFTPVGQNALRRFGRDAFEHVQMLDAGWLQSQSTGELSRVFARGMRGMNSLLRLLVFNVVPTAIEALLVISLLGQRYGATYLAITCVAITSFVLWSLLIIELRVQLLMKLNFFDNRIVTRYFNALINNEAVRSFTNERYEVAQYDALLATVEDLSVRDVNTVSLLNVGQALIYCTGVGLMMALSARRVAAGRMSVGDLVAINGVLLQLHMPLTSLGFTYQEIRQSLTDLRQLLQLLRRAPQVVSVEGAPALHVIDGSVTFRNVSFCYSANVSTGTLRQVSFDIPPR